MRSSVDLSYRRAAAALLMLGALAGALVLSDARRGAYDFQAFYCAGTALREHADPYRTQPLETCEHRVTDGTYAALPRGVALPAPQPPYDVALFALLSLLPFAAAKAVWGALLGMAIAVLLACLARVTRAPPGLVFVAFAASLILPSLAFGQLFAVYAAACGAAALCAQRGNWRLAGIAASAALVEPHLGLPVCLALAAWNRTARTTIIACAALLAVVCLLAAGWQQSIEYAATVLPLHARSELSSDAQLSLSAVLHAFGTPDDFALRIGVVSYVVAMLLGVWCARRLAMRFADDAFLVAAAPAFAAIGGTFIHATEMFAAIPLALLLVMRTSGRYRSLALVALALLSVPWFTVLDGGLPFAFPVVAAIVIFYELWQMNGKRAAPALAWSIAACAFLSCAPAWNAAMHHAAAANGFAALDAAYPQAGWQALNERALSSGSAITWTLRMASWLGLLTLAFGAVYSLTSIDVWSNSA